MVYFVDAFARTGDYQPLVLIFTRVVAVDINL